jgi:hypothetical protein
MSMKILNSGSYRRRIPAGHHNQNDCDDCRGQGRKRRHRRHLGTPKTDISPTAAGFSDCDDCIEDTKQPYSMVGGVVMIVIDTELPDNELPAGCIELSDFVNWSNWRGRFDSLCKLRRWQRLF